MAKKSAKIAEFHNISLPPNWNWKEDSQPERHDNPEDYVKLAHVLKDKSLRFAASILVSAGYIRPDEQGKVVEQLAGLKSKEALELPGVSVLWRIKGENASNAKILKDNKKPDDIGDYLGIKFVGETVDDIRRLRDATISSDNISSRKCEFTYPSERGYRSHKSHHMIKDDGRSLSIETMITHAAFEKSEVLTHLLMESERRILDRQTSQATHLDLKLSRRFATCAASLKHERTRINHETAAEAGLNVLCAPDAVTSFEHQTVDNWARKITDQHASAFIAKRKVSNDSNILAHKMV